MLMDAGEQASFIKNHLGPQLRAAGLNTRILAFDHNWDIVDYPGNVLSDPAAKAFIAGTAFHCYGGNVAAQTTLHQLHPDRDIWHTECSDGTWIGGGAFGALFARGMRELVIGSTRNWGKGLIKWNLALDTANGPTNGGCPTCFGTVTIDQANGNVQYNAEFYALGHASKFVRRGALRIESNTFGNGIENVAFRNPDGGKVLVAFNSAFAPVTFSVRWSGKTFEYTLPGRAAATFTWP
jgi:glucosylceramidase